MLSVLPVRQVLAVVGGAMGAITFLITISFLFTTPGVAELLAGGFPALSAAPGQFLFKDVGSLGASLFVIGESLVTMRAGTVGRSAATRAFSAVAGTLGVAAKSAACGDVNVCPRRGKTEQRRIAMS